MISKVIGTEYIMLEAKTKKSF